MKKIFVTLFISALGLPACNNAVSDVNAVSLDGDATATTYMLTSTKATFGRYEGGFCILKSGALLSVSSIEYENQAEAARAKVAAAPSTTSGSLSGEQLGNSALIRVKANDGAGVKKIEGNFNDRDNRQSRRISVNCSTEVLKKDYTLSCNDWKVSQNGNVIAETACAFLNNKNLTKQTVPQKDVEPKDLQPVIPTDNELGPTLELSVQAYFKPRKEGNSAAPQDSAEIAYCVVKKGFYRIMEEKVLEGNHYSFTLVEKLSDEAIVSAFKPGRVSDPSKQACQGLSFHVYNEQVVKGG